MRAPNVQHVREKRRERNGSLKIESPATPERCLFTFLIVLVAARENLSAFRKNHDRFCGIEVKFTSETLLHTQLNK